jgi:CRISPR-associated protein Cmr5
VTVTRIDQHMAAAATRMLPPKVSDELRTRYRQMPVLVRTAGLAGAYAFMVSKADDKDAIGRAYADVVEGIRERLVSRGLATGATPTELLASLAELPPSTYTYAATDVRALAGWLSRLAEARYKADKAQEAGAGEPDQ